MAKLSDYIKMIDAGYTMDQINGIIANEGEPSKNQEPASGSNPGVVGSPGQNKDLESENHTPGSSDIDARLNTLADSIDKLGALMIASNINKSNQPLAESTTDILGRIIDPPIYKQKERDN